jgi:hypothetical protein
MTLLILCAAIYGAVAAWVFRRTTDPQKMLLTVNRILAHIMEFRLFIDEPSLIWRAQKAALRENVSLLRQLAIPCLIMAVPLIPLSRQFDHVPLKPGDTTIMTAHTDNVPCFTGLLIETPPVHVRRTGEVIWRVRLVKPLKGPLPPGVELRYPRSNVWLLWFFGISTLTALIGIGKHRLTRSIDP